MTYAKYRRKNIDSDDLKIFFAFSDEQFDKSLKNLNETFGTNLTAQDLVGGFGNIFGVKEDVNEFFRRIKEHGDKIPELFPAQKVYDYEFGNYECEYVCDDEEAINIVVELYGADTARKVKRRYGYTEI